MLSNRLNLSVLLKHLTRDVERKIFCINDAAHEAQPFRQQLAAFIHDEDATYVELHAILQALAMIKIEGRLARDVEKRACFESALNRGTHAERRLLKIVSNMLVEFVEFRIFDFTLGSRPDRFHRVKRFFDFALRRSRRRDVDDFVFALDGRWRNRFFNDRELHGVPDEIGVLLDDVFNDPLVAEVGDPGIAVHRLKRELDRRASFVAFAVAERVFTRSVRSPSRRLIFTNPPAHHLDFVGDHEARVEADAKLTDQIRSFIFSAIRLLQELERARAGDRSQMLDEIFLRHANPVVRDRERAVDPVRDQLDREIIGRGELGIRHRLESAPIKRIRSIRDQLAEKNLLVRVKRVDHQVE